MKCFSCMKEGSAEADMGYAKHEKYSTIYFLTSLDP